ncbi:MAG TPA: hypothetical protein VEL76_08940, partial [Gemmataceae bacterium]|nr:hypothetical protein [Gemmataceae bacterium]
DGVSEVACDRDNQTVRFTTTDSATAEKAFNNLVKGGFCGKCTTDTGKVFELKNDAAKTKVNKVTVKDVHVCCNTCRTVIGELFKGTTITYEGKGTQRDVTIAGDNLEPAAVLQTLRNAGFTGTIQKQ